MTSLTLQLPSKTKRALAAASRAQKQTSTDFALHAIERQINAWRIAEIRRRLVPRARKLGLKTDGDVFRHLGVKSR